MTLKKSKNPSDARNESRAMKAGDRIKKKSSLDEGFSLKTRQPVYVFWTHFWFNCEHCKENRMKEICKIFLANINIKNGHLYQHVLCEVRLKAEMWADEGLEVEPLTTIQVPPQHWLSLCPLLLTMRPDIHSPSSLGCKLSFWTNR